MGIYTKKGDQGKTSLIDGQGVSKDCVVLAVVGAVDELNAELGLAVGKLTSAGKFTELIQLCQNIQRDLFKVGSELVALQTDWIESGKLKVVDILQVEILEKTIDKFWQELPPLENFILPSGSQAGLHFHRARTICRRAERELVALGKDQDVRDELYMYLNRLSDFLFASARWVNHQLGEEEVKVQN